MSSEPLLSVERLGKTYRIYTRPVDRLKQSLFGGRRQYFREHEALRDVSFSLGRGESLGVLGQNGAGKSTLLQIVAGTLAPSTGTRTVRGRVAALLELGSGFNPEFTGRENVLLNGAILGIPEDEMRERFEGIVAFSGIRDYIDQPIKTYSSGMVMRLAFSVATSVDPDVLIVDEALSVGDIKFQQRCMTRIREMQDNGVAILFVSHATDAVKRVCQRAIVLEHGLVVKAGESAEVADWYLAYLIGGRTETAPEPAEPPAETPDRDGAKAVLVPQPAPATADEEGVRASRDFKWLRHGDGNTKIFHAELLNADGVATEIVRLDERVTVRFDVRFHVALDSCGLGFYVRDRLGTDAIGINTFQEAAPVGPVAPGDEVRFEFRFEMRLRPGAYDQESLAFLDWINNVIVFEVVDPDPRRIVFGLLHPDVETSVVKLAPERTEP